MFLHQNTFLFVCIRETCPRPSHSPSFHHPNNIWHRVQFSSGTSFSLPHRPTYQPQYCYLPPITIKYQVPHPYITPRALSKSEVLRNISWSVRSLRRGLLAPGPTPNMEDHTLSVIRNCLFNIFPTTSRIWRLYPTSATINVFAS